MGFSLVADLVRKDIFELTGPELARRGIALLLADLDNTLVPYGVERADERVRLWHRDLREHGVALFVLSNNRHEQRPRVFCQDLGVPYLGHAGKPRTGGFFRAMEQMGVPPERTAIVGDQVFTDVAGGKAAGITAILVRPIRLAGNPGRCARYAAELPFRALSRARQKKRRD